MIITGMFLRFTSWRAGAFCIQQTNRSGPSAAASRSTAISLASLVLALAWPLRVLLGLRPGPGDRAGGELELLLLRGGHARGAVARMPRGASAHRLIDHVDDVALLDEVVGPALPTVRRSHPVRRRLPGAVDEHQRVRSADVLRRHHLDVGLPMHDLLARLAGIRAPDVEIAARPDGRLIERRHGKSWRLGAYRCQASKYEPTGQKGRLCSPHRASSHCAGVNQLHSSRSLDRSRALSTPFARDYSVIDDSPQ